MVEEKQIADYVQVSQDGRHTVLGTKDGHGLPFDYANRHDALRAARRAYAEPLVYQAGVKVFVRLPKKQVGYGLLVEDVTPVDKTALVELDGRRQLVATRQLAGIIYDIR